MGVIMLFEYTVCICNFTNPEQVTYFFRILLPRLRERSPLLKTVCFCSDYAGAERIILMLKCYIECSAIPFYGYDAMYTENGRIYPGVKYCSSEELMDYFCGDYNASFTWLLDCNTGLRVWDPRSELKVLS